MLGELVLNPVKEGYLERRNRIFKKLRKRWMVLQGTSLYSFKNPQVRFFLKCASHYWPLTLDVSTCLEDDHTCASKSFVPKTKDCVQMQKKTNKQLTESPSEIIDLSTYTHVKVVENEANRINTAFELFSSVAMSTSTAASPSKEKHPRGFYFVASSVLERNDWIQHLKNQIAQARYTASINQGVHSSNHSISISSPSCSPSSSAASTVSVLSDLGSIDPFVNSSIANPLGWLSCLCCVCKKLKNAQSSVNQKLETQNNDENGENMKKANNDCSCDEKEAKSLKQKNAIKLLVTTSFDKHDKNSKDKNGENVNTSQRNRSKISATSTNTAPCLGSIQAYPNEMASETNKSERPLRAKSNTTQSSNVREHEIKDDDHNESNSYDDDAKEEGEDSVNHSNEFLPDPPQLRHVASTPNTCFNGTSPLPKVWTLILSCSCYCLCFLVSHLTSLGNSLKNLKMLFENLSHNTTQKKETTKSTNIENKKNRLLRKLSLSKLGVFALCAVLIDNRSQIMVYIQDHEFAPIGKVYSMAFQNRPFGLGLVAHEKENQIGAIVIENRILNNITFCCKKKKNHENLLKKKSV
ncbi:hypothetical protein RFI_21768 [Reticulomyxa filosa]|uniref:PH domain-containing protein n=1 Tax=Reticulomyxa filosa TaxID=46433 RepID=X6MPJ0_RETFI|nr:hypothetical protein RFI_21768 [Reticulomyxa filosa]|eukprot:ETO15596.1 hypothetical protein RFI_21768 [Reticulomyxa filosa]